MAVFSCETRMGTKSKFLIYTSNKILEWFTALVPAALQS